MSITAPVDHLASAATCTRIMRSGSGTGSPFLILSTASMPETTSPMTVYWPLRDAPSANMMKNWLFAEFVVAAFARHPNDAALERHFGEFRRQIGIFRAARAVAARTIAGLRHEACDHAVKGNIIIVLLARELLDALGMLGRNVVAQLDGDAAVFGIYENGILRIGPGGRLLCKGGTAQNNAPRSASRRIMVSPGINGRTCRRFSVSAERQPTPERISTRRRPWKRSGAPVWR